MSSRVCLVDNPRTAATSSRGTWLAASWKWGVLALSPHPVISTWSSASRPCSMYAACPCCQLTLRKRHWSQTNSSLAALTPRGCVVPAATAVICLKICSPFRGVPNSQDVGRPCPQVGTSLRWRQSRGIRSPMRAAPTSSSGVPNRRRRPRDARHGGKKEFPPDLEPKWHQDQE